MSDAHLTTRQPAFLSMLLALSLLGAIFPCCGFAADDWRVDGEHGYLKLSGQLLEGACILDMTSTHQDVSLGAVNRSQLTHPGSRGLPVYFTIRLRSCARTGGDETEPYTGSEVEDAVRPVVTLNFTGVSDPDRPSLFYAAGVTGVGLMLSDSEGRLVRPGMAGEPQILHTGDNILTYSVTPVRTPAPLSGGDFRVVTNFEVIYD